MFVQKTSATELEKSAVLNLNLGRKMNSFDKFDILHHSPDHFGREKVSEIREGSAHSSSDSGNLWVHLVLAFKPKSWLVFVHEKKLMHPP